MLCLNCPNDWYHNGVPGLGENLDETLSAIRRIIDDSGAETVIAVGSSMGAFGAVFYGCMLGVDVVVAFGPELIINVHGGFSSSNMKDCQHVLRLEDLPPPDKTRLFYVCGDMSPVDNYCAVVASRLIGGVHAVVSDAHHASALHLKNEGRLVECIEDCVSGAMKGDASFSRQVFDGVSNLQDAHLIAYVEAMNIGARKKAPLLDMANLMLGQQCFAVAHRIGEMIEAAHGPCAETHYVIGWSARKLGRSDIAFERLSAAIGVNPNHHGSQFALASMYEKKGRIADALRHCEAALNAASSPALEKFRKACADMKDRLANL